MLSYSPGWVGRSVASVCLFICTLIGKWLELSTPNLVHIYSIAVDRMHWPGGQRSRSHSYENRHSRTVASDECCYGHCQRGCACCMTAYVFYFDLFSLCVLLTYVTNCVLFTMQRCASLVCAVVVCLPVHPSHNGILPKWPNAGSCKQCPGILIVWCQRSWRNSSATGSIRTGVPNRGGVGYSCWFSTNISLFLWNGAR